MHYDPTVGLLVMNSSWPAIPLFFWLIHNYWSWFSQPGLGTIPGSFLFSTSKYLSPYRSPLLGSLTAGHGLCAGSHIFNNQLRWQCLRKSSLIPDAACTSTHTQTSAKSHSDPLNTYFVSHEGRCIWHLSSICFIILWTSQYRRPLFKSLSVGQARTKQEQNEWIWMNE